MESGLKCAFLAIKSGENVASLHLIGLFTGNPELIELCISIGLDANKRDVLVLTHSVPPQMSYCTSRRTIIPTCRTAVSAFVSGGVRSVHVDTERCDAPTSSDMLRGLLAEGRRGNLTELLRVTVQQLDSMVELLDPTALRRGDARRADDRRFLFDGGGSVDP
mmetsp:Transcript_25074/g.81069  ORF Transcript_25074/g.81069 Transcript_25074/m.81069 type:complete len:163 (-) Transcript_25074:2227-2715(-)